MYESIAVVGERGQITLPKVIRELINLRAKERVVVKLENEHIVVDKFRNKKEIEKLMIEGYKKMAKLSLEIDDEWKYVSKEADAMLDEY